MCKKCHISHCSTFTDETEALAVHNALEVEYIETLKLIIMHGRMFLYQLGFCVLFHMPKYLFSPQKQYRMIYQEMKS